MDYIMDMISEGGPDYDPCDSCTRPATLFYALACCGWPVQACQSCHDLTQNWIKNYGGWTEWDCKHCGATAIKSDKFFTVPE